MPTPFDDQSQEATDCIHWLPDFLDPEPEQCWCLCCGNALPCPTCSTSPAGTEAAVSLAGEVA